MKSIQVFSSRVRILALAALCVVASGRSLAQVVNSYGVEKRITYLQASSAAPVTPATTINDPNGPYFFGATVSGSGLTPSLLGTGALVQKGATEYGFQGNLPAPHGFGTKLALDTAFPNGSYTLTGLTGPGSVALTLGPSDAYPVDIPAITNGTWSGGALQINAVTGMTLDFSTFSAYGAGAGGMTEFHLYTTNAGSIAGDLDSVLSLSFSDPAQTSYAIGAGILTAGQTYFAEISFGSFTQVDQSSIGSAFGYGLFQETTGFSISAVSAIPEPSTYGVVAGFLVLGIVFWRRRFAASGMLRIPGERRWEKCGTGNVSS